MIEIIGVRFKANGKVYYFSPGDHQFQTGDLVVVETSKGTECGEVTIPNKTIQQAAVVQPLKQILRPVNKEDRKTLEQNRKKLENIQEMDMFSIHFKNLKRMCTSIHL